jgi:glucosamine-6-phosphate deaminase|tara:strand:- start:146 stop:2047 length:1902 start_codon:yes stop_codon:yes gene_type:complete
MNNLKYKIPGSIEVNRLERLHNLVFDDVKKGSKAIAKEIGALIKLKQSQNKLCVLGLATGSSPLSVYRELISLHNNGLSFKNVVTFNLDEYFLLPPEHVQSYHKFMHENLFNHIDIDPKNIHIPKGSLSQYEIDLYCKEYEQKIIDQGGIDLQILGIGRTGHIGFNEPGSHANSITRLVTLDHITRFDAAPAFNGIENVPKKAITMGINTILTSKRIILMAWGNKKAHVVLKSIEGKVDPNIPCSYLQNHNNATVVLDSEAASDITRIKTPWLVDSCKWTDDLICKAVLWLCKKTQKSVLKLTDEDYNMYGMSDLLNVERNCYKLNIKIFNRLQKTITGWPGGKENVNQDKYPERSQPKIKTCIIFSPHPDDDVISMGGTLDRLISQGHKVHVVYQTSGSIAVNNQDVLKFIEVSESIFGKIPDKLEKLKSELGSENVSSKELLAIKGKIRESEARAAVRYLGLKDKNIHFLNLPFYETGKAVKKPISIADIKPTVDLINKIKPHQIYAAGDLADPHGTHRKCLDIVFESLKKIKTKPYASDCWVWLYRGAWMDWDLHEVQMAIPLSPSEVLRKRKAIFYHQTQKDGVIFQGDDRREFWVRAEDRNQLNAKKFNDIGLADYEAIELFRRYNFL